MRHFLQISYDGGRYHGWQYQPGYVTVQGTLEAVLSKRLQRDVKVHACGRTDAGVHATRFYVHMDFLEGEDVLAFQQAVARMLPPDIALKDIIAVNPRANVQRDAIRRQYIYRIHTRRNPFLEDYSWLVQDPLDHIDDMMSLLPELSCKGDFRAFCRKADQHASTIVRMESVELHQVSEHKHQFVFTADRYLRSMIRMLMHGLISVASGDMTQAVFLSSLRQQTPLDRPKQAPPQGLYLEEVWYPDHIYASV